MSYLPTVRRALAGRRPGSRVTIDDLRLELCEAAQIPPSHLGGALADACAKGLLTTDGSTVRSVHRPAKGRRILVYRIAYRRRGDIVQPTLLEGIAS